MIAHHLLLAAALLAAPPSGEEILRRVDANLGSNNKLTVGEMVIRGRRGSRSVRSRSWIEGTDRSFTEYLAPPREKGTKMLKLGRQLWTYTPQTDRTVLISGHLLRQSVMGSDLSYEDLLEDPELTRLYTAEVAGNDSVLGRDCWLLDLAARRPDLAYQRRRVWVDKDRHIVLKEERFAKSGVLLKTTEVRAVRRFGARWVAQRILFRDMLGSGAGTEFVLDSIAFNVPVPAGLFTKASLK
ncbi:MAG: outer membrane lipoprotein-sorting protein [bacterium]